MTARRIGLAVGLVAAAVGVVLALGLRDSGPSKGEVTRYEEALKPIVTEWGRVEVQGMRPAVSDLRTGEGVPPETVAGEARAWHAAFVELQEKLRALQPPDGLGRADALFDRSMEKYIEAATAFEAAAEALAGPQREAGIERGVGLASDGARLYNEASMALQAARRRAGLPPSDDFPDHPAGQENATHPPL